jgi:hypothetical protein
MNGSVKYVENQGKNSECIHVKCKFIVTVVWNNYVEIKFHFYHIFLLIQLSWHSHGLVKLLIAMMRFKYVFEPSFFSYIKLDLNDFVLIILYISIGQWN